jgi:hypothetical protein
LVRCWPTDLGRPGDDAANYIVLARNDDRLVPVGILQPQDAPVLNATPTDRHNNREYANPQ